MSRPDIRFSPTEKRTLEFAAAKHKGMTRMGGQEYIAHPIAVAEYLYDHGYRGKYVFTALCHDLLEDTDTTEQDILELAGRFTRDAVMLLTKKKGADIADYLVKIKKNEVAYTVKVADRINNLRDALEADRKFREKYLLETKQYYLDFAEASPFAKDMSSAYEALKEFHEDEEDKRIVVVVDNVFNMGSDPDLNILDAFYLGKGSSECFPIACIIDREEMKFAEIQRGKEIILTLSAIPTSDFNVFDNEEDYKRENPNGFAVRSFCPSWQLTYVDGDEVPDPSACFTGFVKKVHDFLENENEEFHYYAADVDTLGILITVMLRDDREPIPKPGNVVSGVYRLNGYIDTEDQDDDYVKKLSDRSREMKSEQGDDSEF